MSTNKIQLTGARFHRWKVLGEAGYVGGAKKLYWNCLCDCGSKRDICGWALRSHKSKSCGCLDIEKRNKRQLEIRK